MRIPIAGIVLAAAVLVTACSAPNNDLPVKVTGTITCDTGENQPVTHPAKVDLTTSFESQPAVTDVTYDGSTGNYTGTVTHLARLGYRIAITGCGGGDQPVGANYTPHSPNVVLTCRLTHTIFGVASFKCRE